MKCPACQSEGPHLIESFLHLNFEMLTCTACGHAWRILTPEALAAIQNDYLVEAHHRVVKPRWNFGFWLSWRRCRPFLPPSGSFSVLELGCNNGSFLRNLPDSFRRDGIELNAAAVETCRRHITGGQFWQGTMETILPRLPARSYQAVFMLATIEHLFDPLAVLQEVYRVLDDRGIFLVMTGDRLSVFAREQGAHWHLYHPQHLHCFSLTSLNLMCQRTGFVLLRCWWRGDPHAADRLKKPQPEPEWRRILRRVLSIRQEFGAAAFSPRLDHLWAVYLKTESHKPVASGERII